MIEPGAPCWLCGVRPDVECQHRAADPAWQRPVFEDPPDGRLTNRGAYRVATRYGRYPK